MFDMILVNEAPLTRQFFAMCSPRPNSVHSREGAIVCKTKARPCAVSSVAFSFNMETQNHLLFLYYLY